MKSTFRFKPNREFLEETMREVVTLPATKKALFKHLRRLYPPYPGTVQPKDSCRPESIDEVDVKPYCFDSRINWHLHMVTVKGMAIGFTDGPLA